VPIFGDQSKAKIKPKKGDSSRQLAASSTRVADESTAADKMMVGQLNYNSGTSIGMSNQNMF